MSAISNGTHIDEILACAILSDMEKGEEEVRQVFEDLLRAEPVEPGTDPRDPHNRERFEDSEIGQAVADYSDTIGGIRKDLPANDA